MLPAELVCYLFDKVGDYLDISTFIAVYREAKQQQNEMSCCMTKTTIWDFDQVQHKSACTAIEDVLKLEISSLGRRGIILSV